MNDRTRWRISGAAAIAGGLLRVASTFTASALDASTLQLSYFVTDVMLLFGLLGIYLRNRDALRWGGSIGFALGMVGILTIRSAALLGSKGYEIGAGALLVGLAILGFAALAYRTSARVPAVLWLTSLVLGTVGAVAPGFAWSTALAGIAFGLGFALAGWELLRQASPSADQSP